MAAVVVSVVAVAGAAAAAAAAAVYTDICESFDPILTALGLKAAYTRPVLPPIPEDAPQVQCCSEGLRPKTCQRRVSILRDGLLVGRKPGPADICLPLEGAEVNWSGEGVFCRPKGLPPLVMTFITSEGAERFAEALKEASQMDQTASLCQASHVQRVQSARISELEARVAATLRAAVDRATRIRDLEVTVEQAKGRDDRIKELETLVQETTHEVEASQERIRQLEVALAGREGADPAAQAILDDAMRFAEQMLEGKEDLAIDGKSARLLQEAIMSVQKSRPDIDQPVAELISRLVSAMRFPLILRQRLANAEQTVKEQKEIQDQTRGELRELRHRHELDSLAKEQAEGEARTLRRQLALAEEAAQEANTRLQALEMDELTGRKGRNVLEDVQRTQAEAEQLRNGLANAEASLKESQARLAAIPVVPSDQELAALQRRHEEAEKLREAAEERASKLGKQLADADELAKSAETEARELRAQLAASQVELENAKVRQRELLDAERAKAQEEAEEKLPSPSGAPVIRMMPPPVEAKTEMGGDTAAGAPRRPPASPMSSPRVPEVQPSEVLAQRLAAAEQASHELEEAERRHRPSQKTVRQF